MNPNNVISKYFNTGVNDSNTAEVNQKIFAANIFGFVGYGITFILGILAFVRSDDQLGYVLLFASFMFYSSRIVYKIYKVKNIDVLSANLITYSLILLMTYLVYSGGANDTGALWIYVVPPIALYFGGIRVGLRNISIFLVFIGVLLFYPDNQLIASTYSYEFKTRLLYSFITVTILFTWYEYLRQKTFADLIELSQDFERQARQDTLTGLQNRRGMLEKLNHEQLRSQRSKKNMSILMCDIDHYKVVNDQYGHECGDLVLQYLAEIFVSLIRKQDMASRWGGEEFLFVLPETSAKGAYHLAEKIRLHIQNNPFPLTSKNIQLTVSFGIYEMDCNEKLEQAINQADHFLYQAKEDGRNLCRPQFN